MEVECHLIFTGRNEVVAKVIFLQASVCPRGGGASSGGVSALGGCLLGGVPPQKILLKFCFFFFLFSSTFFLISLGIPPPRSTLEHMVNKRPVHILLECILVFSANTAIKLHLYSLRTALNRSSLQG